MYVNPCAAQLFIIFRHLKFICAICTVHQKTRFGICLFFSNRHIFRHLMLEIASEIPASNEEK